LPLRAYAVVTALNRYTRLHQQLCCFVLGIDCNKFTVFPSTFYDSPKKKFYRTGLKLLSLTNGKRCDCSFSPLLFTHPCNDIFLMNICIVSSTTLYTEEDSHQGSKRLYL